MNRTGMTLNDLLLGALEPEVMPATVLRAMAQAGIPARDVIVLEGVNDISRGTGTRDARDEVSAQELIAAHTQLVQRAHERGVLIYGGTLTPIGGMGGLTPERIAKRDAFNAWMRTSGVYDAVIDFDRITRDPSDTTRFLPAYDSGDHLHPNDAGYKAMGDAISLALFRRRVR